MTNIFIDHYFLIKMKEHYSESLVMVSSSDSILLLCPASFFFFFSVYRTHSIYFPRFINTAVFWGLDLKKKMYILSIPTAFSDIKRWGSLFHAEILYIYGRVQKLHFERCRNTDDYYNLNLSSVKHLKLETHSVTDIHIHHEIFIWECYHGKLTHDTILCFHIFSKFLLSE